MNFPKPSLEYVQQLEAMAGLAMVWRVENPDKQVNILFNFPPDVMVVACISDAIKMKMVTCNEAGLELIKAISDWGQKKEATVFMVRMAVEHEGKKVHKADKVMPCPHCNAQLGGSICVGQEGKPTKGDLSLCGSCAELLQFDGEDLIPLPESAYLALKPEERESLEFYQDTVRRRNFINGPNRVKPAQPED